MSDDIKQPQPIEAAPFESMNKAQMRNHLFRAHNVHTHSKETIAELKGLHDRLHRYTDPVLAAAENRPSHRPLVDHFHAAVPVTDEDKARLASIKSGQTLPGGPISTSEIRTLTALVDNDFATLRTQIKAESNRVLSQALAEYEESFQERRSRASVYASKADEAQRRFFDEIERLKAEADSNGVTLKVSLGTYPIRADAKDYETGKTKVQRDHTEMLNRALLALEAQRLTVQRRVMLLGVSELAAEVLDTIPSAQSLMAGAQGEPAQIG